MKTIHATYPSSDGIHAVHYRVDTPDERPHAVVQFIHGMSEFVDRYEDLAKFFCANGVVFCGEDHLGHGQTASPEEYGYFGDTDGPDHLVEDVHALYTLMRKTYRRLPYIMIGHSLGSFILRQYLSQYGGEEDSLGSRLDGAVLMGTAGPTKYNRFGVFLASMDCRLRGTRHRPVWLKKLMLGGFSRKFKGETGSEWLNRDLSGYGALAEDPRCNFVYTAAGDRDVMQLLYDVNREEWASTVPLSMPVLLLSGGDDPVGGCGAGVQAVADALEDAELNELHCKLYPGARHELLFESCRDEVYADLLAFTNEVAEGVVEAKSDAAAFTAFFAPLS